MPDGVLDIGTPTPVCRQEILQIIAQVTCIVQFRCVPPVLSRRLELRELAANILVLRSDEKVRRIRVEETGVEVRLCMWIEGHWDHANPGFLQFTGPETDCLKALDFVLQLPQSTAESNALFGFHVSHLAGRGRSEIADLRFAQNKIT